MTLATSAVQVVQCPKTSDNLVQPRVEVRHEGMVFNVPFAVGFGTGLYTVDEGETVL